MINKDFFAALDLLEKELKVTKETFLTALEAGLVAAYNKDFDTKTPIEVRLNPDKNEIRVFALKNIVEEVEDYDTDISLEEAKKIKVSSKIGAVLQLEVTPKHFSRQATQTCMQVVKQRINDSIKERVQGEMKEKIGNITLATVRSVEEENIHLEIVGPQLSAIMGKNDFVKSENYRPNQNIKVYVKSIKADKGGNKIYVSRKCPEFVAKLFESEVPEIKQNKIVIKSIVREAGNRTKMAVYSEADVIDPVGACIGPKGSRINAVVSEIGGEKIDIIKYESDPEAFVRAALAPAPVVSSTVNELEKSITVYVNEDKLSLAIGKDGQNVRLAARLTGWKIDIKPMSILTDTVDSVLSGLED